MGVLAQKLMDAPASSGYSCTITIGNLGSYYGYYEGALGSLDAEPIPGYTSSVITWDVSGGHTVAGFHTDILSLVNSLNVWIGGVNFGGAGSWYYDSDNDVTEVDIFAIPSATSGTILFELR